jgi:hypothetical protein
VVPLNRPRIAKTQNALDLKMQQDWEIKSRSHQCTRTGRDFAGGEIFYTLLFREPDGYRREDLCEEAYVDSNENIRPFSFWKSTYEPPPPPKKEVFAPGDAEGLLRHLISENQPETRNARFILAAMLERKRLLRPLPSEEKNLLVYEHPASGEVLVIEDPVLSLEQLATVQAEVSDLLASFGWK